MAELGDLEARLVLAQTEYDVGEPLAADVYLANVTEGSQPGTVTVDGRLSLYVHVRAHILDQRGREVQYPGWNLYAVLPAAQRRDFVELPRGYLYGRAFSPGSWELAVPRAGTYEVYATFGSGEDGSDFGLRAWTGSLESNHVTITVRQPSLRGNRG